MVQIARHRSRFESTGAFLIYLAITLLLLGRGLFGHFSTTYLGHGTDPGVHMWYLRWWSYALEHRVNPFLTGLVWAPRGLNLAWSTFVPLLAWVSMPIGSYAGENAAYNLLCLTMVPLAALAAYLLCRRITGDFCAALFGGYLFGFSAYMLGHLRAHLCLVAVFPLPLLVLSVLRRLDGKIPARRCALELSALLIAEFLCDVEICVTATMLGAATLAIAYALTEGDERERLVELGAPIFAAGLIAVAVLSPYLYYLLIGVTGAPLYDPSKFSSDLLNFLVPTEVNWVGTFSPLRAIAHHFALGGLPNANTAYIGLPLILILELYRRRSWTTVRGKLLIALTALAAIAMLGPVLHVAGRPGPPMPWAIAAATPILSNILPDRFSVYLSLTIAIIAADWFACTTIRPAAKYGAAVAIVLFIFPNPFTSFWTTKLTVPSFFSGETYRRHLKPDEIILPLPYGPKSMCMLWQERAGMYFKKAGGWTGRMPFEFEQMPVTRFVYGAIDLPEAADQFKAYIARFGVSEVVADPTDQFWPAFKEALAPLGDYEMTGGIALYKVAPQIISAYRDLPGAALEARAVSLRFDSILEASAKFLATGHDASNLSPLELLNAKLLPATWRVDAAPDAYSDWTAVRLSNDKLAVAVTGTYDALRPLIDRYLRTTAKVYCPAPRLWTPKEMPIREKWVPLVIEFDRAGLAAAAAQLKSSPPSERTTPFLAWVKAWRPPN